MAANYDEEVTIPVRFVEQPGTIQELKDAADELNAYVKKYEKSKSKRGQSYVVPGAEKNLQLIDNIIAEISKLSEQWNKIDMTNPFTELEQVTSEIAQLEQVLLETDKERASAQSLLGNNSKELKKDERELLAIKQKEIDLQAEYDAKLKATEADTTKGSKSRLKNLQAEYSARQRELNSERSNAELKVNLDNKAIDSNREELKQKKFSINATKEEISKLKEKQSTLEKLSQQEGYEEQFAQQQLQSEKEIENTVTQKYKTLLQVIQATRELVDEDEAQLNAEKEIVDTVKEQERAKRAQIGEYKSQISAVKQSTAQYYYQLRAVKMLGFSLSSINNKMSSFGKNALKTSGSVLKNYLKLTNVFSLFGKTFGKIFKSLKSVNTQLKSTDKNIKSIKRSQEGVNLSLKEIIKNVLKYGLGIRSIFVLFNKLRKAMSEGMENLATQWDEVNGQMSSVITSLFQMKNAVAAAVQPILTALAPALEKIAEIVSDISYKIASFIAALTGTTQYVYKAKRAQQQFVDTTDDATKAIEDEKKELSGLDKLNVLTTDKNKDKNKDNSVQDMFDKVEIDPVAKNWAEKFKKWLEKFFEPFKKAWDREGKFVMDAWKKMMESVKKLMKDIVRDFEKVWLSDTMVNVWSNLLHVLGDIFLIIGNIADALDVAWNHNNNGYRILLSIAKALEIITQGLRDAADYTVKWSANLTFVPLFDAIADTLEDNILPALQSVVNLLVWVYEKVFLEMLKHFIEVTAPKLVKMIGNIATFIGNIAENLLKALTRGNMGESIVKHIENIVDIIADTMLDITESTAKWAEQLKFYKLVEAIRDFLKDSEAPIKSICNLLKDLWNNVLLPLAQYLIEKTLPAAFKILGNIAKTIGNIVENIRKAFSENKNGEKILGSIKTIAETIGSTVSGIAEKTEEWSSNLDFGPMVESIAGWLKSCEAPIQFICDTFSTFYTEVLLPFWQYIVEQGLPGLLGKLQEINNSIDWDSLTTKVNEFLKAFEPFLEKVWEALVIILGDLGEAIAKFVNSTEFETIVNKIIEWMNNADPETMATGIEKLVQWFIELKAAVSLLSKVIVPLATTIMTIWNAFLQFGMVKKIGDLTTKIDGVKSAMSLLNPEVATLGTNAATASTQLPGFLGTLQGIAIQADDMVASGALGQVSPMIANIIGVLQPIAGIAATAVGAFKALSSGASMLAKGFNLADEASMLFGIALTSIGAILLGAPATIAAAVAGIAAAVSTLIILLGTYGDQMLIAVTTKFNEMKTTVGKWFNDAGKNLGKKIGELISDAIKAIKEFPTKFKEWFDTVDWAEFGINILKGILAIFLLPGKIVQLIEEAIGNFFKGFVDGLKEGFDMHSPSKKMEPYGENIIKGILEGITTVLKNIGTWINKNVIQPIMKPIKDKFKLDTLVKNGKNFVTGLWNGMKNTFGKVKSDVTKKSQELVKGFRDKLKPNTLTNVGKQLINGLKTGLNSALSSALATVSSLCSKIVAKAKQAFQVHSPSKVFMEIGEYLTEGLVLGMEEDSDDTDDAMEELIPSLNSVKKFASAVTEVFASMRKDSILIVHSMIDELNDSFAKLDRAGAMEKMISRASQISTTIKAPRIAEGYQLPSNKEFLQSMEKFAESSKENIDSLKNSLPDIMKQAFIDAITETANLQTNDETIIVNIDGKNIFQAVRSENAKYKKQHGASAFA